MYTEYSKLNRVNHAGELRRVLPESCKQSSPSRDVLGPTQDMKATSAARLCALHY